MENFAYKTEAELQDMTSEQRDGYATSKREFEKTQSKEAIKNAIEDFKKVTEAEQKTKDSASTQKFNELEATIKLQGEKITELNKSKKEIMTKNLEDVFQEKYEEIKGEREEFPLKEQMRFSTKDILSTDVMSVNTVESGDFPASGSTGIVNNTLNTLWGRVLGFFGLRKPQSMILELVDIQPINEATLIAINDIIVGDAAVTPECTLKPIVKYTPSVQTTDADPVAAMWFTTTKLRRFYPALVNRMREKFAELVNDKIPAVVLAAIRTGATAFTPNAAFQINSNPNNYDALGAVIASIEALGLVPNAVVMHPFAWRNMKQDKTDDGVYTLSNGQSISILDNGLDWGGIRIPIIKDPSLAVDEFVVGDLYATVKVGADTELLYMETDGRVDDETTSVTGLSKNIRTHVLEKFVAVIIPTGSRAGLIRDTFSNVKTLISAPAPSA